MGLPSGTHLHGYNTAIVIGIGPRAMRAREMSAAADLMDRPPRYVR